ncbi:hypothetical protein BpHYR1_045867 [Brachionus plicatilis]|uniref:Uncharacterized protein n=1 Tax=Brachionus plicatilis TaxID=10195 RepID=A0A3M7QUN7_BRAPC|nr:hypothetical protein BpHYR1_045867 [Brachionus plicatilis]
MFALVMLRVSTSSAFQFPAVRLVEKLKQTTLFRTSCLFRGFPFIVGFASHLNPFGHQGYCKVKIEDLLIFLNHKIFK